MILHINKKTNENVLRDIVKHYDAFIYDKGKFYVAITSSNIKEIEENFKAFVNESFIFDNDIQLSSSSYMQKRKVDLKDELCIGGDTKNTLLMIGPCSIESKEQVEESAKLITNLGLKVLRAGAYKPRTSPYSFQGLAKEGLKILSDIREKYKLKIITEARDSTHIDEILEYTDIVQIGAKAMYDHGILKACSKSKKPVLIKRSFGSTLQEFVQAAEFVLSGGNENVMLCERGIRTFETKTRFTLDLCGVAYLKQHTNLPIVLDPSHAMGYSYGVSDLSRACLAMGIDGLLIEVHPNPKCAKSDASQQLNHKEFTELFDSLKLIAKAINVSLV